MNDLISRAEAIDAISSMFAPIPSQKDMVEDCLEIIENLPPAQPAQPTLYGYNMEYLKLIAEVLRKENLPPERVVEALTDIGRIASIIRAEFDEELRKAVERCMI